MFLSYQKYVAVFVWEKNKVERNSIPSSLLRISLLAVRKLCTNCHKSSLKAKGKTTKKNWQCCPEREDNLGQTHRKQTTLYNFSE